MPTPGEFLAGLPKPDVMPIGPINLAIMRAVMASGAVQVVAHDPAEQHLADKMTELLPALAKEHGDGTP